MILWIYGISKSHLAAARKLHLFRTGDGPGRSRTMVSLGDLESCLNPTAVKPTLLNECGPLQAQGD